MVKELNHVIGLVQIDMNMIITKRFTWNGITIFLVRLNNILKDYVEKEQLIEKEDELQIYPLMCPGKREYPGSLKRKKAYDVNSS